MESKTKTSLKAVQEALQVLGKKNFVLIAHGSSFPSVSEDDTGFGNPNSEGARRLTQFISGVFTGLQLGPGGKTKAVDSSPYTSTIFSNNPLFIDLKQLTDVKWGNILPEKDFKEVVSKNPNKDKGETAYTYIYAAQEKALKKAFENFKSAKLPELKKAFENFKSKNSSWLEKDSLYEALSAEHENDYWPNWTDETDKRLFSPKNDAEKAVFKKRIEELQSKYTDIIEFYNFCQFVIYTQNKTTLEFTKSQGLKMLADRQVAFSDRDTWAYQSIFLDGWQLGCPPDYFSKSGQAWGFPVIDPEKLFHKDGSLGEAGMLMKDLYKKMLAENPGGIRIDHIVGLIDPWVYKSGKTPKPADGAGRLFSSPEHEELKRFAIATMEDLDQSLEPDKEHRVRTLTEHQIQEYGKTIKDIIIQAVEEAGIDKDCIVCEDLGTLTRPVEKVMKYYDLLGMRLTQFVAPEMDEHPYRAKNIPERCWVMAGTHDNEPVSLWAKKIVNTEKCNIHAENLCADLFGHLDFEEQEQVKHRLRTDADFLTFAKAVELFASKAENVQVFFTDYFGIEKTYNTPGTSGSENWSLRIPNDFEEVYLENLRQNKGFNLPKILKAAIEARGKDFSSKHTKLLETLNSL